MVWCHDYLSSVWFSPFYISERSNTSLIYSEGNRRVRQRILTLAPLNCNSPLVCRWMTATRCGCGAAPWRWRLPRRSCSTGCWGSGSCGREACVRPPSSRPCPRTPKSTATSSRARATAWAHGPHRNTCCSGNEARRAPGFTGLWVLTCWALRSGEDGRVTAKNTLKMSVWFKVGDSGLFCVREVWMGLMKI